MPILHTIKRTLSGAAFGACAAMIVGPLRLISLPFERSTGQGGVAEGIILDNWTAPASAVALVLGIMIGIPLFGWGVLWFAPAVTIAVGALAGACQGFAES